MIYWIKIILIRILPKVILDSFVEIKKVSFEKYIARKTINKIYKKKLSKAVIIYDNFCSPPTFGDFFFVLMLARYFLAHNVKTRLIIIDGEYREDWSLLDVDEKNNLVRINLEAAKIFLAKQESQIDLIRPEDLQKNIIIESASGSYILFKDLVRQRLPIYKHALNTLNFLCEKMQKEVMSKFLLSAQELQGKIKFNVPDKPYVTWNCRYSQKWELERNANDIEFIRIYAVLHSLFPDHEIMIVSDKVGCDYFRKVAMTNSLSCLYSKDYSDSLIGDGALILNSDYFYVLRGGGITVFPLFSKLPYKVVFNGSNEIEWSSNKATSWASVDQHFCLPSNDVDLYPLK
jgi:hypothetical protein